MKLKELLSKLQIEKMENNISNNTNIYFYVYNLNTDQRYIADFDTIYYLTNSNKLCIEVTIEPEDEDGY